MHTLIAFYGWEYFIHGLGGRRRSCFHKVVLYFFTLDDDEKSSKIYQ